MNNTSTNNLKLGAFVVSGLAFLVFLLYMIGRNQNLFESTYILKAHVKNAQGLVTGNNVRYAGIEIGTVKKIRFVNDTLIEISLTINSKMKNIIRKNAKISIGSEGLVGNKVLNIASSGPGGQIAVEGDVLTGAYSISTEDMLLMLEKTNKDVAIIAAGMRTSIERLNNSKGIWKILDDEKSAENIRKAAENIKSATGKAENLLQNMEIASASLLNGKGTAGMLLTDTTAVADIRHSLKRIRTAAENMDTLTGSLNRYANEIYNDINSGNNTLNVLLKDSLQAFKLKASMNSVEKGTAAFTTNMEALKHNFFFRGYFRKIEKKARKQKKTNQLPAATSASR
jgi:phospholipid/cholesterol/gamma-HCH transport system substrate-binding protein